MSTVILLGGWQPKTGDRLDYWATYRPQLVAAGFTVLEPYFPNNYVSQNALIVKQVVDAVLPDEEVHFLGYSLGTVSGRYYVKNLAAGREIKTFVMLDPECKGNIIYSGKAPEDGGEFGWLCAFMQALINGDDTPPSPTWVQVRTHSSKPTFDGGVWLVDVLGYAYADVTRILEDPVVYGHISHALAGAYPGAFV